MDYSSFFQHIEKTASTFADLQDKHIRIVSHLDCDGLAAASILIKAFVREGLSFSTSIVRQLDSETLKTLEKEEYDIIFFLDLGSGYLNMIEKNLPDKKIFILDHHRPEKKETDIIHVNPHNFGIDGGVELSGAGVTYLFAKELNQDNQDLAHLAIIGAIGDIQEKKGFKGINKTILEDAVNSNKINLKQGLSMFGMQTRPLHKVLELSTDPYIPGVTGNEKGAVKFLNELGISLKENGKYKKLIHLDEDDMKKLVTGIILRRLGSEKNPEDIMGNIYLLSEEEDESPTKDVREFSTLLNSCGRLRQPSLGIGTCLGNKKLKSEAISLLSNYKQELIRSLNWFYSSRKSDNVIEEEGYTIISAEDKVKDTMVGTLASIISRSNIYRDGTIIISMAHTITGETKVSMRVSGYKSALDLREIAKKIVKVVGGESGGHKLACGCIIPQEKDEKFISAAKEVLSKYSMEESIN